MKEILMFDSISKFKDIKIGTVFTHGTHLGKYQKVSTRKLKCLINGKFYRVKHYTKFYNYLEIK